MKRVRLGILEDDWFIVSSDTIVNFGEGCREEGGGRRSIFTIDSPYLHPPRPMLSYSSGTANYYQMFEEVNEGNQIDAVLGTFSIGCV